MLTLQGLRALNEADIIVHDPGVSDEVLALARRDADVVMWSGGSGSEARSHREMLEQLLKHVEQGLCVVHLHPGDAWLPDSSPGLTLPTGQALTCEVVPGIRSGSQ